jgi:hypothetical protein
VRCEPQFPPNLQVLVPVQCGLDRVDISGIATPSYQFSKELLTLFRPHIKCGDHYCPKSCACCLSPRVLACVTIIFKIGVELASGSQAISCKIWTIGLKER